MRVKKSFAIFVVLVFLVILAMVPMRAYSSPSPPTVMVDMPDGYIPGETVGTKFWVDILIDASDLTYNSMDAMSAWGIYVEVDPTILKPFLVKTSIAGYFLYDFSDANFYDYPVKASSIDDVNGIVDVAEQIMPPPPGGAATDGVLPAPYLLVSVAFESLSETGYSKIDIVDPEYRDNYNVWHPMDAIDGHYNEPTVEVHDVAVTDVTPSKAEVYPGWTIDVDVTVKNEGDVTETFDVTLKYDDTTIGTPQTATNLAPDASTTLKFNWDTTGVTPCISYTITAEAAVVPEETDTADNSLSTLVKVKLAGDVDGSGKVDFRDLFDLAAAYGSEPPHTEWNQQCDFDQSNKVDYEDLFDLAENYGTEYSCP